MRHHLIIFVSTLFILALSPIAHSEETLDQCERETPSQASLINAGIMTVKLIEKLDAEKSLDVALIARAGSDPGSTKLLNDTTSGANTLRQMIQMAERRTQNASYDEVKLEVESLFGEKENSPRNLHYSHIALIFRNHPQKGPWHVVHLLSPCHTNTSNIYDEGLARFFMDNPYDYSALVLIPKPELQKRLKEVLFEEKLAWSLKAPVYNVAALPGNNNEANSNGWPLDILAAALKPSGLVRTREEALQVLKDYNYRPSKVSLRGMYSLAIFPLAPTYIKIRPKEQPFAHSHTLAEVVSVLSIQEFMNENQLLTSTFEYTLPENLRIVDSPAPTQE